MATITPGQLSYWRNRLGRPDLTPGQASYQRSRAKPGMGTIQMPQGYSPPANAPALQKGVSRVGQPAQAPSPPPPDPLAIQQRAALEQRRSTVLGDVTHQRNLFKQDFGIEDTSNPYNRAAMLRRAFEQSTRGNTNSYAARGQLYSGALQNVQGETQFGYQRDTDQLHRSYRAGLDDFSRRERDIQSATSLDLLDVEQDRVARALANRPDPQEVPAYQDPLGSQPARASYLPPGYESWDLDKKRSYWARRRKERRS